MTGIFVLGKIEIAEIDILVVNQCHAIYRYEKGRADADPSSLLRMLI